MVAVTDADLDRVLALSEAGPPSHALAASVCYDRQADLVVVTLTNGCTFSFPPRLAQGLERASAEAIAAVEILGAGSGLHWESLDVDLSVEGLLNGRFGSAGFMAWSRGIPASREPVSRPGRAGSSPAR